MHPSHPGAPFSSELHSGGVRQRDNNDVCVLAQEKAGGGEGGKGRGGGSIPDFESGVLALVQRREWRMCLSAAVGLREHWQERSRSSAFLPPSLTRSALPLVSVTPPPPFLCSFATSNRLLLPPPSPSLLSLLRSNPRRLSFSIRTLDGGRSVAFGQRISETSEREGREGKDHLSPHTRTRTPTRTRLVWPEMTQEGDVCSCVCVCCHAVARLPMPPHHVTTPLSARGVNTRR